MHILNEDRSDPTLVYLLFSHRAFHPLILNCTKFTPRTLLQQTCRTPLYSVSVSCDHHCIVTGVGRIYCILYLLRQNAKKKLPFLFLQNEFLVCPPPPPFGGEPRDVPHCV